MSLKFGDAVILVQKSGDGTISRTNAIVLGSRIQPFNVNRAHALKDDSRKPLPEGEYLDLAYPNLGLAPEGTTLKTRTPDVIFRLAYDVHVWSEELWIGWEPATQTVVVVEAPGLPSEADLDAVEEEKKIAEATSGAKIPAKVRQIKGK